MKKSFLLLIIIFISQFLSAQTTRTVNISSGNLWSSISKDDKEEIINLTINGTMDSRDFKLLKDSFPSLTSLNLSNVTVTSYNGTGANSIPDAAFTNNKVLTAFLLPKNLTTVGVDAFNGCANIVTINFPASLSTTDVTSFRNFGGLFTVDATNSNFSANNGVLFNKTQTELIQCPVSFSGSYTIPSTITTIKAYSFNNCIKLTDVASSGTNALVIEDFAFFGSSTLTNFSTNASTTTVKTSSFESCPKLTTFNANLVKTGNRSFIGIGLVNFNAKIIELGNISFYGCTKLKDVTFSSPISIITYGAFSGCNSLINVVLPASVATIDGAAYVNCKSLSTVSGASILVNDGAFNGCDALTSVNATITGIGNNAFTACGKLKTIAVSPSITSIGKSAFEGCLILPQFTVSATTTSIGTFAFRNCGAQLIVDANNPNYSSQNGVLYDKSKTILIQSPTSKTGAFSIPDGVVTVKAYSFYNNNLLTEINIPASVCNIEPGAFFNCGAKKTIISADNKCYYTPDGLVIFNADSTELIFCSQKKTGAYSLPKTVYKINDFAFSGCNLLTNVTLNNGLTIIGANAFDGAGITSIFVPASVKKLGIYSFANCKQATTLAFDVNSTLDSINNYAFANCSKLTSLDIPKSVVSIGNSAFYGCAKITSFPLNQGLKNIGESAFAACSSWTGNLVFPNSISQIGKYAFSGCIGLNGVLNIPSSISIINDAAFYNCPGFSSIKIPNSITAIGAYAFYYCKNATSVNIPTSVKTIGGYAFLSCSGLYSIHAEANQPVDLTLSAGVFSGVNKNTCTLFVPAGAKNSYKKAVQWKDFYHIIEGLGFWVTKDTIFVSDVANTDSVFIGSNTTWTTRVIGTSNWLTSSPATGNFDGKIFTFSQENFGDKRIAYIEVKTQDSKDTITVIQRATSKIPDIYITSTSMNICNHQKYNLKAIAEYPISGAFVYDWDFGDAKTASTLKDTIHHEYSDIQSTTYNIKLTVKLDPYQRTFTKKFVSDPLPVLVLDNKPLLCDGDTMIVHVKGADKYTWSNGTKNDSLIITKAGTYSVQGIKNDTLCSFKTFTVNYFPKYEYSIDTDNDKVKSFLPLVHFKVEGPEPSEYKWEFEKNGEILEGKDVYYLFKDTEEKLNFVKLTATTPDGCHQIYYKLVEIVKSDAPNIFTPNGDGKNDVFLKDLQIQVYDKNGKILYEGNEGWDGTYKGNKMPQDTYYYVIIFQTQAGKKIVGNYVMLVR